MIDNSSALPYGCRRAFGSARSESGRCIERPRGIIANPNCTTIQMVVALKAIENFHI